MDNKKDVGTVKNLGIVALIFFVGIGYSMIFTTIMETHQEAKDFISQFQNHNPIIVEKPVIIEKVVYVPVVVYDYPHNIYEYTYCDFRKSFDNPCMTFTTDTELNEFDTGASWLILND